MRPQRCAHTPHRTELAGWRRAHLLGVLLLAGLALASGVLCDLGAQMAARASRPLRQVNLSEPAEWTQVALLASKLEQWLACYRLRLAGQQALGGSPSAPGSWRAAGCAAHFDGRLCWPDAATGDELRLGCPRASWLPGEHSIKSVINSIQSPPVKVDLVAVEPGSSSGQSAGARAAERAPEMERQAAQWQGKSAFGRQFVLIRGGNLWSKRSGFSKANKRFTINF